MNTNTKGNIAIGKAIAYFTMNEYTISIPLNDCQWYDLIIEKNNIFQTVQVKYTSYQNDSGTYACKLSTTSGSTGKKIYNVIEKPLDLLFIYCENGYQYLIPIKEIPNKEQITLYDSVNLCTNKNIFDTSIYLLNEISKEENIVSKMEPVKRNFIKKVLQYDLEGNFINKYDNCSDAARKLNLELRSGATNIARACRGERKTAYNFQWKYQE